MKRTIRTSVCLFLAAILLAAMGVSGLAEQAVALTMLEAPTVWVTSVSEDSIALSWEPVSGALEYEICEYFEETGLLTMLGRTAETTATMENLQPGSTHSYIVQPISYVDIADNVSPEYRVTATCG